MNEALALHIWGKNYPAPATIKTRVMVAAAGENHMLFGTSSMLKMQAMDVLEWGRIGSGSWGSRSRSFTSSRWRCSRGRGLRVCTAGRNTRSSSMVLLFACRQARGLLLRTQYQGAARALPLLERECTQIGCFPHALREQECEG